MASSEGQHPFFFQCLTNPVLPEKYESRLYKNPSVVENEISSMAPVVLVKYVVGRAVDKQLAGSMSDAIPDVSELAEDGHNIAGRSPQFN